MAMAWTVRLVRGAHGWACYPRNDLVEAPPAGPFRTERAARAWCKRRGLPVDEGATDAIPPRWQGFLARLDAEHAADRGGAS